MSFFSSLFGNSDESANTSNINWNDLFILGQLDEIIALSENKPIAIFKHSTRCSISRMALKQFENDFDMNGKIDIYLLDLLNHRDISNAIAERFDVTHQSPQLIVIKNGKAVFNASHESIDAKKLVEFI